MKNSLHESGFGMIETIISLGIAFATFFFFLSGNDQLNKQVQKSIEREQAFQLPGDVDLILSSTQKNCNCNLNNLKIDKKKLSTEIDHLDYFPGSCTDPSFPMISTGKNWHDLDVKKISLENVTKFSDGYIGELSISLMGKSKEVKTSRYNVAFRGKEDENNIEVTCNVSVKQIESNWQQNNKEVAALSNDADFSSFCVILGNAKIKCINASTFDTKNTGENIPYVDLGEGRTARDLWRLRPGREVSVWCAQLDDYSVKCWTTCSRDFKSCKQPISAAKTMYGHGNSLIKNIQGRSNLSFFEDFSTMDVILDSSEKKKTTTDPTFNSYANPSYTALAILEDGRLMRISHLSSETSEIFLGDGIKAESIAAYDEHLGCVQTTEGKLKCWGLCMDMGLGGTVTQVSNSQRINCINYSFITELERLSKSSTTKDKKTFEEYGEKFGWIQPTPSSPPPIFASYTEALPPKFPVPITKTLGNSMPFLNLGDNLIVKKTHHAAYYSHLRGTKGSTYLSSVNRESNGLFNEKICVVSTKNEVICWGIYNYSSSPLTAPPVKNSPFNCYGGASSFIGDQINESGNNLIKSIWDDYICSGVSAKYNLSGKVIEAIDLGTPRYFLSPNEIFVLRGSNVAKDLKKNNTKVKEVLQYSSDGAIALYEDGQTIALRNAWGDDIAPKADQKIDAIFSFSSMAMAEGVCFFSNEGYIYCEGINLKPTPSGNESLEIRRDKISLNWELNFGAN